MRILATSLLATALLYPQIAPAQVERWMLAPEVRIGSVNDPRTSLTRVTAIALGRTGNVFVAQPQKHQISVFRSNGQALRVIGRAGQGPGEFSDLMNSMGFLGDTLWATDDRVQRVNFFDEAGNVLRSTRISSPEIDGKFGPTAPTHMLANGTALVSPGYAAELVAEGRITRRPLLRISRTGAVLDTILWRPVGGDQISINTGGFRYFTSQPFADGPLLAISPSGERIVVVERKAAEGRESGHFLVTQRNAAGDIIFSKRYRYTPVPMPRAYVDSVVDATAEGMANGRLFRSAAQAEGQLRKVLYLPAMRVPITSVLVADDGSIWLKREDRPGETQGWNVLRADGEVRATLSVPKSLSIQLIGDNSVWGVEKDEFDIPYLVRYGIRVLPQ